MADGLGQISGVNVQGQPRRAISLGADAWSVEIIDQTRLPHELHISQITTLPQMAHAIEAMQVRGAPLIGVAACYGLALALRADASDASMEAAIAALCATRPTAVNLRSRLFQMRDVLRPLPPAKRVP
ncbi:MAG TPA: S-methyl-5-thioribose-1-phosphate isomerase, partial [Myxococcaceae bacterium]|nr:S-methyl-5-thioribose-1-phosphate isomerase [Myxococcaceae bacterium]